MTSNPNIYVKTRRRGWPLMTPYMLGVLQHLRQSKADGWPYVLVPDVCKATLVALFERDWIFASPGSDGARYGITERGERALKVYEAPGHRYDGICPTCGLRPKHVSKSGRQDGYCLECGNASKRRAYRLKRPTVKVGRMCSRCHKRPVHVLSGGRAISYCLRCKNLRNRKAKKNYRKHNARMARLGIVKTCTRPGCTRPRHVTPSSVYELCREHYREWYNDYRHRKRALTPAKKGGRPPKVEVQP